MAGKAILLNGASSSGKSTLVRELRRVLPEPFLYFSFDHLRDCGILPMERIRSGEFDWTTMREPVFEAVHRIFSAVVDSNCNLIAEHIVENEAWRAQLAELFAGKDVFVVSVWCPLEELERREQSRGNRSVGEARRDFESCYSVMACDFQVDGRDPAESNARAIFEAWSGRSLDALTRFGRL